MTTQQVKALRPKDYDECKKDPTREDVRIYDEAVSKWVEQQHDNPPLENIESWNS